MIPTGTIRRMIGWWAICLLSCAGGSIDTYQFTDRDQHQRFMELTNVLRCPTCQNQTIADSNAPIAQDLRREVHRLLQSGADNQAVIDFMLTRYGDFILYQPRFTGKTLLLWFGPGILLVLGLVVLVVIVRRHRPLNKGEKQ